MCDASIYVILRLFMWNFAHICEMRLFMWNFSHICEMRLFMWNFAHICEMRLFMWNFAHMSGRCKFDFVHATKHSLEF